MIIKDDNKRPFIVSSFFSRKTYCFLNIIKEEFDGVISFIRYHLNKIMLSLMLKKKKEKKTESEGGIVVCHDSADCRRKSNDAFFTGGRQKGLDVYSSYQWFFNLLKRLMGNNSKISFLFKQVFKRCEETLHRYCSMWLDLWWMMN